MNRRWPKYYAYARQGDWQLHTTITDGKSSIREYFEKATENGLHFLHFSEHVRRELSYDYLKFKEEVYSIGAQYSIPFAVGAEAKVLNTAGDIDISDEIAREAELIIFSYHSKYFLTKEDYITSVIAAAQNPLTDIWGHPTSYAEWLGFSLSADDWKQIAAALKQNNICYEINEKYVMPEAAEIVAMVKAEVPIVLSTDAHHIDDLMNAERRSKLESFMTLS